ncbi:MAG: lipocalin-like domain-containing protein [Verrucomicrobiales bacterium]|nr:lipocalin-like domain-containing protein [Verrucomicrobiales bacterium]
MSLRSWIFIIVSTGLWISLAEEEALWSVPEAGVGLTFPGDHGSHPDFKIEWWYLTGHLFEGDQRFGFQATFFRLGQEPVDVEKGEAFGESQIYLAHMGLSDPETGRFLHEERLNRGGWDAGAKVGGLDVFNGDWKLLTAGNGMKLVGSIKSEAWFDLKLTPHKRHVIFGEGGVSRKGPEGTAASYYITFPRLDVEGTLRLGGKTLEVHGSAWMDHEISSSQLARNQVGWDWACLQLFDGREIMGYVLRTESGEPSEYSRLVWINPAGELTHQKPGEYSWIHQGSWESPTNGAVYPITPIIETFDPERGVKRRFQLIPTMPNQEMSNGTGGVSYWEGACDVIDLNSGNAVGHAFLEMTGYADNIAEKLR